MEGDREVARDVEYYNLDVIISVGVKRRVRLSEEKMSKVNHSDIDFNLNDDRDMHQNTMAILEDVLKKQANIRNNILNQKRKNNDHIDNYSVFDDNDSIKKNSRTIGNRDIE